MAPTFAVNACAGLATLRLTRGKVFRQPFVITRRPSGVAFDLTGHTMKAVATLMDTGEIVADFDSIIEEAAAGRVVASLTADQTAALEAGSYWWELECVTPDGIEQPLAEGVLEVVNRGRHK